MCLLLDLYTMCKIELVFFIPDYMFSTNLFSDIRDLISLDDAMEDDTLHFGPNGGLVFCME